jgi:hypothetical protein
MQMLEDIKAICLAINAKVVKKVPVVDVDEENSPF